MYLRKEERKNFFSFLNLSALSDAYNLLLIVNKTFVVTGDRQDGEQLFLKILLLCAYVSVSVSVSVKLCVYIGVCV